MAIHSRRLGAEGGLPALLAHCFLGHSGTWSRLLDVLPTPLDALAFDMPGHGRSAMPDDPGDFHDMVSGIVGGMLAQPSLLIGHSFGAASMLRHALLNPRSVTGLVLIEPVYFAAARHEPEYAPYIASENPLREAVAAGDLKQAARHFLALNEGSPELDSLPAPVQDLMAQQMLLVVATKAGLIDDSGGLLEPGVMESFDKPVLLMRGSQTSEIFHGTVRALARMLPKAEVAVIEGAGHMVPISHARQTAAAIQSWLERTGLAEQLTEKARVE